MITFLDLHCEYFIVVIIPKTLKTRVVMCCFLEIAREQVKVHFTL